MNFTGCVGTNGSLVELHCSFNNSSNNFSSLNNVTYRWWNGDKVLNVSSEMIKYDSFNLSDAGSYQCKVFSSDGHLELCGRVALTTREFINTTALCMCLYSIVVSIMG